MTDAYYIAVPKDLIEEIIEIFNEVKTLPELDPKLQKKIDRELKYITTEVPE